MVYKTAIKTARKNDNNADSRGVDNWDIDQILLVIEWVKIIIIIFSFF